ncbi:MAG: FAD/NAD(P)-binding protein [Nodosilinea sp.]
MPVGLRDTDRLYFVSRYLFGSYVQAALQGAQQQVAHAHLDTYRDEVVDLVPGLDGVGEWPGSDS